MKYTELLKVIKSNNINDINIFGSGPSICNLDLDSFNNTNCVFINGSIVLNKLINSKNSFLVSTDSLILKWSYSQYIKDVRYKIFRENNLFKLKYPDAYYFTCLDDYESIKLDNDNIVGFSSLIASINIFIKLGCEDINIYGFDGYENNSDEIYFWHKCHRDLSPYFFLNNHVKSTDKVQKQQELWVLQNKFISLLSKYGNIKINYG